MKYIDADKLKAEIERLQRAVTTTIEELQMDEPSEKMQGELDAYDDILWFIESLQQEQSCEDLEEAAEKKFPVYWKNYPKDGIVRSESSYDTNKQCRDAFLAGANWQKEQMLKDAVDGFIFQAEDYYPKQLIAGYDGELGMCDKVKIVIVPIKEDKK